jgi:hypothetical protein
MALERRRAGLATAAAGVVRSPRPARLGHMGQRISWNGGRMIKRMKAVEAENERLREAITDALADLTPGIVPYSVLADALKAAFDEGER